jgi:hypothetical protein
MNTIVKMLLIAPDSQLDASMKELIKKWDEVPKAIQILEVLDVSCQSSLASDFIMTIMDGLLHDAIKNENTTMEEIIKLARWRNVAH